MTDDSDPRQDIVALPDDIADQGRKVAPYAMTTGDVDWYRKRHYVHPEDAASGRNLCHWCGEAMPCPTVRWIATVDAFAAAKPAALPYVHASDTHQSSLDVAGILDDLTARKCRLRGLWVQYDGDGTGRARHNEVVVSIQYDRDGWGVTHVADGKGKTVREACSALRVALTSPQDGKEASR